jgi:hypothetical protein
MDVGWWPVHSPQNISGLATTLVGIEVEPTHFSWLKDHVAMKGFSSAESRLVNAPVAGSRRDVIFASGRPLQGWGQALVVPRQGTRIPCA